MWGKQVFATFTAGVVTLFRSQSVFPVEEPCHRPKQQKRIEFQRPKLESGLQAPAGLASSEGSLLGLWVFVFSPRPHGVCPLRLSAS